MTFNQVNNNAGDVSNSYPPLEQTCQSCVGVGTYLGSRCQDCGGSGKTVTAFGREILEMVRKHARFAFGE